MSVDRGSDVRRSLSLTIANPSDFPTSETSRYGIYGQQIYVERGIKYIDGTTEMVPLGTFVVTNVSGNIHTGPLSITAIGKEIILKRALFESATSTAGYASASAFISTQIGLVIPGASYVNGSTSGSSAVATKTWDPGAEIWAALVEVANSVGAELFCDAAGTFRLVDVPDINMATPVWTVNTGEGGVMVSADMEVSADDVYNRVVASGENSEDNKPPVSAEAKITLSTDPLRYGGPFGKVSKTYSSSLITSTTQAQSTANALLRKYRAANRTVTLNTIPNPALDAGDCIRVKYGSDAPIAAELHLVQSFTVPLTVDNGSFTIATVSGKDDV
ncbi:DUF5047 domain-containing protein [Streptomyces chattanoogensis]|uniref:DUF5047 domain-containing protein n=1 Tax=Streptomyces chattanoogensis TaxID=66876 RepID=UPI0036CE9784